MNRDLLELQVRELFHQQLFGVLATNTGTVNAGPYVSLIAFAATSDLSGLIFLTSRATSKFNNIMANNQVSMLIDNRTNQAGDFQTALAVTVIGRAVEQHGREKAFLQELFLACHPELERFALEASSALFKILVNYYILVSQFKKTDKLIIESAV
jgi:hypothetical protein